MILNFVKKAQGSQTARTDAATNLARVEASAVMCAADSNERQLFTDLDSRRKCTIGWFFVSQARTMVKLVGSEPWQSGEARWLPDLRRRWTGLLTSFLR
jgi:hypothetical protein